MSDVSVTTVDDIRKWTKAHLKSLKELEKQLTKSDDADTVVKGLDAKTWKEFRKKAKELKGQSRNATSFKSRVVKEAARNTKRFTKVFELLSEK